MVKARVLNALDRTLLAAATPDGQPAATDALEADLCLYPKGATRGADDEDAALRAQEEAQVCRVSPVL